MQTSEETMRLSNINDGAADEIFGMELEKIVMDIMDPNKEPDKPRTISLKITFKPSKDDENFGSFTVTGNSSLAPVRSFGGHFVVGREDGKGVIRELVQESLFEKNDEGNLVPFERKEQSHD